MKWIRIKIYDKNGNKIDGTYSQLNQDEDKDKKPIEFFWIINSLKIIPVGVY